jgi:Putative restriction endonuclease
MSVVQDLNAIDVPPQFPDHTQLPESDGTFVKNFQEHPQSIILTDSIDPVLQRLHPDGQYAIGQDCGIYWRETEPPEKGAEAPDWFYVPRVPARVDGQIRRSYVLWREFITPTMAKDVFIPLLNPNLLVMRWVKEGKAGLFAIASGCDCPLQLFNRMSGRSGDRAFSITGSDRI